MRLEPRGGDVEPGVSVDVTLENDFVAQVGLDLFLNAAPVAVRHRPPVLELPDHLDFHLSPDGAVKVGGLTDVGALVRQLHLANGHVT